MPTPTPAVRLRAELTAARRRGEDFDSAWPTARARALEGVASRAEANRWEHAFGWARPAFEDGWGRCGDTRLAEAIDSVEFIQAEADELVPHGGLTLLA